jgi:hypothetical protein
MCPDNCGLTLEEATGPGPFLVDEFVCNATKARERKKAMDRAEASKAHKAKTGEDKLPDGWETGRIYFIRGVVEKPEGDTHGD